MPSTDKPEPSIHPTAVVHKNANIGSHVSIGPYCIVDEFVTLEEGCVLHSHAIVTGHTTMGPRCEVFPTAVIGAKPQDMKFRGETTLLKIGSGNQFREQVTVHPGTANGGGETVIGDNNLFLVGSHVAHDCHIGHRCILANGVQLAGHVNLEDGVNIGGGTGVHHFTTIGKYAMVGGLTRISGDVPPFVIAVAARGPRSEIRMINRVGLARAGYSDEDIAALKLAFMKLYSRKARLSNTTLVERTYRVLETKPLNEYVEYFCKAVLRTFEHGRHGRYLESLRPDKVIPSESERNKSGDASEVDHDKRDEKAQIERMKRRNQSEHGDDENSPHHRPKGS
jgi:UDP-N-acetylglucosamine acyltransferase